MNWNHWRCDIDSNGIAWLTFDKKDERINTLSQAVWDEFAEIIDSLESKLPSGVVLQSGKDSGFILGADIKEFSALTDPEQGRELVASTHQLLKRWEALPMPTVAIISGLCLGGGLELALATDYRVADSEGGTKLGLPEVRLGIQPGWGGSVRLPRLLGVLVAMPLMLTGKLLPAKRAQRLGLIDHLQPLRHCRAAALSLIEKKPKLHRPGLFARLVSVQPFRWLFAALMKRRVTAMGVCAEHYPAPFAMIDNWKRFGLGEKAFEQEINSVVDLMLTPTSQQLQRVFALQNQLKDTADGAEFVGKRVHVIGAGTMGGDIAAWCALQGFQVTLQDRSVERIAPAMHRAADLFAKKHDSRAMDRLQADVDGHGIVSADLIIEAIFENLEAKQDLFRDIEQRAKPTAILASNTSSIPLAEMARVLENKSRLVGIHFFNPVSQMQLVEIVSDAATDPAIAQQAARFVRDIDRLPLPVNSSPGFLVNRILVAYLMEAILLFDEGVEIDVIDQAAVDYGLPMGPIRLADTVGLDVCFSVAKNLLPVYGGEMPVILRELVESDRLGVKSKQGFYSYGEPSPKVVVKPKKRSNIPLQDVVDRLVYRQLNESLAALREGVVAGADLLDAGMIYGTGFAPFRGGPMQVVKTVGAEQVALRLKELASQYGERFEPDSSL